MGPLRLSMVGLETKFTDLNVSVDTRLKNVEACVKEACSQAGRAETVALEAKTCVQELREELSRGPPGGTTIDGELQKRVQDLEAKIVSGLQVTQHAESSTLAMGGFKISLDAATLWTNKVLQASKDHLPAETYKLGKPEEQFKGLLFMRFCSPSQATTALKSLKAAAFAENQSKESQDRLWCDFKTPIEERTCNGFLFGLRRQLIEWKFPSQCVKVEKECHLLKVAGKAIVQVRVQGDEFKVNWLSQEWAEWPQIQTSNELAAIMKVATAG